MDPRVVVLGDANVDMVICLPDRASGAPDLTASEPQVYGGGSAANAAVALARLGVAVSFVGSVGDDGFGRWLREDLAHEGVDTRGLITARDAFTPMVIALVDPGGERWIVVWPPERGADLRLRPEDLDLAWMAGAAWLHTTGMCLRASPVREAVLHGMALAREAGASVSLDLNLRVELWGLDHETRQTVERAVQLSDVVLGSGLEEIGPLAGLDDVEAAARAMCGGKRVVVARLGADGALAAVPASASSAESTSASSAELAEIIHAPAFPTSVVDTLGAGDAFDAGFVAACLAGNDTYEALRWGNAVAALKIGRPGARGVPTRAELEGVLKGGRRE
jgi:sugar/nucleoside kinase (ribokinase family)